MGQGAEVLVLLVSFFLLILIVTLVEVLVF